MSPPGPGQSSGRNWPAVLLPPLVVLAVTMAASEILVRCGGVPAWLLPPPSRVLAALVDPALHLWRALLATALAAGLGFAASGAVGVLLAVLLSSGRWVRRAFYPYAIFFQTVPIIAIAPLLVIWLGYGLRTIVVAAFVVAVFPVIANTLAGLLATDPALVDLFRLYGASRWATLWKLRLPGALPDIFTGLRIAAGLAVIGTIVSEFFAATDGLGVALQVAIRGQRADVVFAIVLLGALLGLSLFALVNLAAHWTLRHWHVSERKGD